jgi:hypothetical protein
VESAIFTRGYYIAPTGLSTDSGKESSKTWHLGGFALSSLVQIWNCWEEAEAIEL